MKTKKKNKQHSGLEIRNGNRLFSQRENPVTHIFMVITYLWMTLVRLKNSIGNDWESSGNKNDGKCRYIIMV